MKLLNDTVLLVEDNEDDVAFMSRAWKQARITNPLQVVTDGQQAIDYLSGVGMFADRQLCPLPCLVFLDLKLPYLDGFTVLQWIREQPGLRDLDVVVLTCSGATRDLQQAYRLGAKSYVIKPPTADQLVELVRAPNQLCLETAPIASSK